MNIIENIFLYLTFRSMKSFLQFRILLKLVMLMPTCIAIRTKLVSDIFEVDYSNGITD